MNSMFDPTDQKSILERLGRLEASSARHWGKMNPAQMLAHCSAALETVTGVRPMKQKLLGKILTPFIRSMVLGEKPFSHNSPTDPTFVIADERELETERRRFLNLVDRFVRQGPDSASSHPHVFFGKLSGEEWGRLTYKHLDHHWRQFGI